MSSSPDDISALTDEQRFGKGLARARKLAGWNQEDAAARCGVGRQQVSEWETGKTMVPEARLIADLMRQGPAARDAVLGGAGVPLPTSGLDLDRTTEQLLSRLVRARDSDKWIYVVAAMDSILRGMVETETAGHA